MNAQPARGLVFSGQETGVIPWTLLAFILLSACVHAFGFFIFQILYPPASRAGPPPVQVGLLVPGTPEADTILRWIDSEDPALAAEPGHASIPGLLSLPYIPSYATVHARPIMAAPADEPLPYPDGPSGVDLVKMAASQPAPPPPPPAPAATALSFSATLKDIVPDTLPSFVGLHEGDLGELQPARFLLGVSDRGEVRYVFLQDSSGDKILDAGAGRILTQVRFRPSSTPIAWGFATFFWGSAVYARPSPAPEGSGP
jgi:hypothetical protein